VTLENRGCYKRYLMEVLEDMEWNQESYKYITSWGNSVPSPKTKVKKEHIWKDEEKGEISTEGWGHAARIPSMARHTGGYGKIQHFAVFSLRVWGKTKFFNPNPSGNMSINTRAFIHKHSFRTWRFKKKADTGRIKRSLSSQPLFLAYVLFLL